MPVFDPHATAYAAGGMVASVDHVASGAGTAMLRRGGSAADAAIAANAVLAVVAPHLCGMGGDLLALVHRPGAEVVALNASGRAGSGADADGLRDEGAALMPYRGDIRSVTVPGCVDGWCALHDRFGHLPLADVLAPAAALAADGFAATTSLAGAVHLLPPPVAAAGLAPPPRRGGSRVNRPGVARALVGIGREGRASFYEGAFGSGLVALGGGEFRDEDLARPGATWEVPLHVRAFDHDLYAVGANTSGYLVLAGAALADRDDLPDDPADGQWAHLLVEAAKLAAFDRPARLHEHTDGPALVARIVAERRERLRADAASALPVRADAGDTTYVAAVDADRLAVSLIQSNAADFGSHLVEPATGIFLHNRGIGFCLEAGHPAAYGPGRRPPSTLAPVLVTRSGTRGASVLGTMGGDTQPQIVLQLLARILHAGQRPGGAVAAPRWVLARAADRGFDLWSAPDEAVVTLEAGAPDAWVRTLRARGHRVDLIDRRATAGHAHAIVSTPDGTLAGAADHRAGAAAALGI